MHHKEAKENMFVDRYLAGQLGAREQRRFEEHFIGCEACQEELELTERLRDRTSRYGGYCPLRASRKGAAGRRRFCCAALCDGCQRGPRRVADRCRSGLSTAQAKRLDRRLRRSSRSTRPEVPPRRPAGYGSVRPSRRRCCWSIPAARQRHDYRVVVSKLDVDGATTIAEVSGVRPSYEDLVAISVPGNMLAPGPHLIQLEGREQRRRSVRAG